MLKVTGHSQPGCLSEFAFDRLHADELSPAEARALASHVASCAKCSARQRVLCEGDQAFLAQAASQRTLETLSALVPRTKTRRRFGLRELALAAALALGCLLLLPRSAIEGTRSKGGVQLGFFVKRGASVFRGGPGERLYPGDQLRFTVRPRRAGYLAILALDQRGVASVYYPAGAALPQAVAQASDEVALDSSTELDESLGAETIFALFCASPRPLEVLRRSLATRRSLTPQEDCQLDSLRIHKEPTPP